MAAALVVGWAPDVPAGERAETKTTLVASSGRPLPKRWQRWVRRSLMPIVRGRVKVGRRGCPAHPRSVGCVYSDRLSVVYIDERRAVLPATLYHELGHLFDWRVLNNRDRRRFKRLLGKSRQGWFSGREKPAEQFAEAYSFCARYRRIRSIRTYTTYGYDPSPAQHRRACQMIVEAARPSGSPPQPAGNSPATINDPQPPPPQPPEGDDEPDSPPAPLPPLPPVPPLPPLPR